MRCASPDGDHRRSHWGRGANSHLDIPHPTCTSDKSAAGAEIRGFASYYAHGAGNRFIGKPATGLKPEDFGLLDGQKPQKIATFSEVDGEKSAAAVRVLVVLDAINDGGTSITRLKKDLGKLFSGGNGPLQFPLSLVFVSASGVTESQPSTDRGALAAELAELARRPHDQDCEQGGNTIEGSRMGGGTFGSQGQGITAQDRADCMIAHFTASVNALRMVVGEQEKVRGRAIVIWTGRGWPLLADFGNEAVHQEGNYRDVLVDLANDLREAEVTLDAISWGDFEHPKNIMKPLMSVSASVASTPNQIAEEAMALPALAQQSGGQALAKVKDFSAAMASVLADGGHYYTLSFDAAPGAAPDEFHSIEIKVGRPGVRARTVAAFFAQP